MSKQITAFKCDWCSRCFGRLCDVNRHEPACKNNPSRQHCKTCVHGVLAVLEHTNDMFGNPVIEDIGPFCDYHDKPIHEKPYFIDCGFEEGGWGSDRPLPGTCVHYEYKGKAEWTRTEE